MCFCYCVLFLPACIFFCVREGVDICVNSSVGLLVVIIARQKLGADLCTQQTATLKVASQVGLQPTIHYFG